MGAHDFKHNDLPPFAQKPGNIDISRSAALKLALVPASRYYCDLNWSHQKNLFQVSLGLKEVQMRAHDFKHNKLFCQQAIITAM